MSEKAPDYSPAPGILPEGMYGPDNFAVTNSKTGGYEAADARGFKKIDKNDIPASLQDHFAKYADDSVFLESPAGYKVFSQDRFKQIQDEASAERDAKRAPLYAEAEQQLIDQLVDEHDSPEAALNEASELFDEKLDQFTQQFVQVKESGKRALTGDVDELTQQQRKTEQSLEQAAQLMRSGINQPERARQLVSRAIEELTAASRMLSVSTEGAQTARSTGRRIANGAEEYKAASLRLGAEFRAIVARTASNSEVDPATIAELDERAHETVITNAKNADMIEDKLTDLGKLLGGLADRSEQSHSRVRSLLGRMDDMSYRIRAGRFNEGEYQAITRSINQLLTEHQGAGYVHRLMAAVQAL